MKDILSLRRTINKRTCFVSRTGRVKGSSSPFKSTNPQDMIGYEHVRKTCPFSPQLLQNITSILHPLSKLLFRFRQMSSQTTQFRKATFTFSKNSAGSYSTTNVTMSNGGFGYYSVGDSFVIYGTYLGGTTPTNDLTITVLTVNTNGTILTYNVSGDGDSNTNDILFSIGVGSGSVEYAASISSTRDASDITKMLKQRIMYNEKKTGSPINTGKSSLIVGGRPQINPAGVNHLPAGNAEILWQPQGNQFRLSYLFGKVQCETCNGGAFNLNGPLSKS